MPVGVIAPLTHLDVEITQWEIYDTFYSKEEITFL